MAIWHPIKQEVVLPLGHSDAKNEKTVVTAWSLGLEGNLGGGFKYFYFHPYLGT